MVESNFNSFQSQVSSVGSIRKQITKKDENYQNKQ